MAEDGKIKIDKFDGHDFGFWKMHIEDYLYQKKLHAPLAEAKPTDIKAEDWTLPDRQALVSEYEMKEGASVADHLNGFNLILSRLMSVDIKFDDEVQALLLLSSLPESWSGTLTSISGLTGTIKLKFDNIRDLILGEDIRRKTFGESKSKKRGQSKNRHDITCWNCNEKGHFQNQCMKPVASKDKEVHRSMLPIARSGKVHLADDKTLDIAGVEDVVLKTSFGTSWTLKDVRGNETLWHQRLGHMSEKVMKILASKGRILDLQKAVKWKAAVENETNLRVKCLKSDNGGEYSRREFIEYCVENGIWMLKTEDSVTTEAYLINRQPFVPLGFRIPKEEWQGKEVSLAHLKAMAQMRWDIAFGIRRGIRSSEAEMSHLMRTLYMEPRLQQISVSENSGSFEDSERLVKEDSEDGAFSEEGGSETPQVRRSTRESRALVRLPSGMKALQSKWVFRVKKSNMAAKVVKMTTIKLVLSIVATEDLHIEQLDVKTAFLHGDLDKYIYMTQPEGFQSIRKEENLMAGYKRCDMDHCCYLQKVGEIHGKVLEKFNMKDAEARCQPLGYHFKLSKQQAPKTEAFRQRMAKVPYASSVGSVMYAMEVVKWLLCYLKGTLKATLCFSKKEIVLGFSDSDYGGCLDSGKSATSYVFTVGGTVVSWMSRIQKCVAMSTIEAEYMAITEAGKESVWLKNFLEELYRAQTEYVLFCDNQIAIHLEKNLVFHGRTKHIKIRYHYIRELVSEGTLSLKKILRAKNPADMLTKVVTKEKLKLCAALTGLQDN
ncbi:retrovirus-related pol polyprotein from transposon TNT 1-94 [Tanacetum coccineum]